MRKNVRNAVALIKLRLGRMNAPSAVKMLVKNRRTDGRALPNEVDKDVFKMVFSLSSSS